jgi:hypothetical protein
MAQHRSHMVVVLCVEGNENIAVADCINLSINSEQRYVLLLVYQISREINLYLYLMSKIRLTAFFVLLLIIVYILTGIGLIPVLLLLDFTLRGFGLGAYSPLAWFSGRLATALRLPAKPVYMPPKRFAARIGLVFCLAISVLHFAGRGPAILHFAGRGPDAWGETVLSLPALILSSIIALFAALESLAGFCAGCYVYNAYARLRHR